VLSATVLARDLIFIIIYNILMSLCSLYGANRTKPLIFAPCERRLPTTQIFEPNDFMALFADIEFVAYPNVPCLDRAFV
jgi:hypothetical protein